MTRLRILVTGSRLWTDELVISAAIGQVLATFTTIGDPVLVHGGARGADSLADREWRNLKREGYPLAPPEVHEADWDRYGRSAGHRRNATMVDLGAVVALAFPLGESRGTRGCMALCRKAGIPLWVFEGDPNWPPPITPEQDALFDEMVRESRDLGLYDHTDGTTP